VVAVKRERARAHTSARTYGGGGVRLLYGGGQLHRRRPARKPHTVLMARGGICRRLGIVVLVIVPCLLLMVQETQQAVSSTPIIAKL